MKKRVKFPLIKNKFTLKSIYFVIILSIVGFSTMGCQKSDKEITVQEKIITVPLAPSNLSVTSISSNRIDITWDDNSDNETGFIIEKAPYSEDKAGSYEEIATADAGATFYYDESNKSDVPLEQINFYRIRAYNEIGNSAYSNEASNVDDINRAPILNSIGDKSINEDVSLSFTINAIDPDNDILTYSAENLPNDATFDTETQTFNWTPTFNDNGVHTVTFTVIDNNEPKLSDSETISIYVGDINRAPTLNPIGDKSINEGEEIQFTLSGSDPDGDDLTFSPSTLPSTASFNSDTQLFSWTPGFGSTGIYNVTFTLTDDGEPNLSDSETISIYVGDINRAPILNPIGNKSINEDGWLIFIVTATDPDSDILTYSANNLPNGATFDTGTQIFNWLPDYSDSGQHEVTFTVNDSITSDSETITISVGDVNRAPVLNPIGNKSINEDVSLSFTISAIDPDNDGMIYSADNLPNGATFDTGTQTFNWTPDFNDYGVHIGTFTVTDNGGPNLSDSETISIYVGDINRAPILNPIGDKSINEGEEIQFTLSGSDPDGDDLTFSPSTLPLNATFNPDTQLFSWTPEYGSTGEYEISFILTDDGEPNLSDSETITISVGDINRAPILNPIGDKSINEEGWLIFIVTATDPDNDSLTYSADNLPNSATFDTGTQIFNWLPDYSDSGQHEVTFTVTDGVISDSETITITVGDVNRAPILNPIGDRTVDVDGSLSFTVSATDPDNDGMSYSADNLPNGASLDSVTGQFNWSPNYGDSGEYEITFTVTDDDSTPLIDSETITIFPASPPCKPIISGVTLTKDTTPQWTWVSGGNGCGVFRYSLDNDDLSSEDETIELSFTSTTALCKGYHTLYIQERNTIGTWSPIESYTIKIDKSFGFSGSLIYEDEFNYMDDEHWYWLINGEGSQLLTPEYQGVSLNILNTANDTDYSNSAILIDDDDDLSTYYKPFFQTHLQTYVKSENIDEYGSRGWGYWNGNLNPYESEIAWFVYVNGPEGYPDSGFFTVTQSLGQAPVMNQISSSYLDQWHCYSIDWQPDSVTFRIDDNIVSTHTESIPSSAMRIDFWVDNTIYDRTTYLPLYQNISEITTILIDSIHVFQ